MVLKVVSIVSSVLIQNLSDDGNFHSGFENMKLLYIVCHEDLSAHASADPEG